jgi:hypothetical protein
VGTVNVDSRAPAYPPFIVALRERGPTAIHDKRPRSGRGSDRFPDTEITFLTNITQVSIINNHLCIHPKDIGYLIFTIKLKIVLK